MKTVIRRLAAIAILLTPALATAQTGQDEGLSPMVLLFMGFGALIIVFQLVPGLALFTAMLKEIFARLPGKAKVAAGRKADHKL